MIRHPCILILISLTLLSCGSSKVTTSYNEQKQSHSSLDVSGKRYLLIDSSTSDRKDLNITRYFFSPPDSSGRQHITQIERAESTHTAVSNTHTSLSDSISLSATSDSTLTISSTSTIKKTAIPFSSYLYLILSIAGVIICYRIVRFIRNT